MDRQLLSRATDSSDAPTPGYMYLDIAKNAASSPAACMDIAKYLINRLQKNNSNVKYKCLKIISKTSVSPYLKNGQFKRCLAQDPSSMATIKEAIQYRGPPDPVRGDQPYEKVRTAAKEALDAIYSDTPSEPTSSFASNSVSSSMMSPSYGGNAYSNSSNMGSGGAGGGSAGMGASGGRRMDGIGNPMFADPRLEPQTKNIANMTATEVFMEAKETVLGMIKDPLAKNVQVQPAGGGGGYGGPTPVRVHDMRTFFFFSWRLAALSNDTLSPLSPPTFPYHVVLDLMTLFYPLHSRALVHPVEVN